MKTDAEHMRDGLRDSARRLREIMRAANRMFNRQHLIEAEGIAKDMELAAIVLHRGPAPEAGKALDLVLRLHREGTLSEGQVSTALGIDRVAVRALADAVTMCGLCGCAMCGCGRRYDP